VSAAAVSHRVVVVDAGADDEGRLERLRATLPTEITSGPGEPEDIVRRAAEATVLVTLYTYTSIGAAVLERLPNLALVATRTAGYSHIDVAAAARLGIAVTAVPDAPTAAVAEYTFGVLMMSRRRLADAAASTRSGAWQFTDFRGRDLEGETLGVVGLGRIGRRVAALGHALGMRVLGWSRRTVELDYVERVGLEELLEAADVVSINVSLNEDTRGLLDARRLAMMRTGAWLVNTARGEVLDTDALCEQLREGRLGGACLDVVAGEPLDRGRALELAAVPNLVVTPHISWNSTGTLERQFGGVTNAVISFCAGQTIDLVPGGDPMLRRHT
jgi:phosphoglycerate dehydrogenase-like enzyme